MLHKDAEGVQQHPVVLYVFIGNIQFVCKLMDDRLKIISAVGFEVSRVQKITFWQQGLGSSLPTIASTVPVTYPA